MRKQNQGFSLIEVMTVVAISVFVFGAIISVFLLGRTSWTSGETLIQLQQGGRQAIELMTVELSQADRNSIKFGTCSGNNCASVTFQVPIADASQVPNRIYRLDGTMKLGAETTRGATITYWVSSGQLKRKVYYNSSGTEGAIPPGLTLQRRLKLWFAAVSKFIARINEGDFAYATSYACPNGVCDPGENCSNCPGDCGPCPCGNDICEQPVENCSNCPTDCGACAVCGDGYCETSKGETCSSCSSDCGICLPNTDVTRIITDNISSVIFTKDSAKPGYVGITLVMQKTSGGKTLSLTLKSRAIARNIASEGKTSTTTSASAATFDDYNALNYLIYHDYAQISYACGDGTCNGGETCNSCPGDCGTCSYCGDHSCNGGETCNSCPGDCGVCIVCGNGLCQAGETCCNCPTDCNPCVKYVCSSGCFLGGTPILMADGTSKPVEQIKVGELVMAFDENTKQLKSDKVKETFVHNENEYFIINRRLKVTASQPIYANGQWEEIKNLKMGDELLTAQGQPEKIFSIEKITAPVTVYNLEVNPYHTYIAGRVVVHNKTCAGTPCCGQNGCEPPAENATNCPEDCGGGGGSIN